MLNNYGKQQWILKYVEADEIFDMLMGDRVEPRREFIDANAKYVTNLDF